MAAFEQLLQQISLDRVAPSRLQGLSEAYSTYQAAFSAWKAHDSSILVETMIAQYVELDLIWQSIKDDTEEAVKAEYRDGIRNNQVLLMVRIKRLAGPEQAKMMIRDAIRRARRNRAGKPMGDARPRAAARAAEVDAVSPDIDQVDSQLPAIAPYSPSVLRESPEAEDLIKMTSSLPDNRTVVHELAINQEFRIGSAKSEVRKKLHLAVFQQMRQDIRVGQGDRWIVAMAENIREKLLRLLTPGNSLHTLISEALDASVVARECSMGSFSYERFFSFMLTVLPRLCAPFRDGDVRRLAEDQSGDVIDRLARLMQVIDLLSLDYANYILQSTAPRLISEAEGYERRHFAADLAKKEITLERTQRWWRRARERAYAEASRRDPENIGHAANRPTLEKVYWLGLQDLAITPTELKDEDIPETLSLDKDRLMRMRSDSLRIVLISSILLTAKNLLKRDVRTQWKAEASKMWQVLSTARPPYHAGLLASLLSTIESAHPLPAPSRAHLTATTTRFLAQAASQRLHDPVLKLLLHRLRTHVLARLVASTSTSERVRLASICSASEGLSSSGMPEFVGRVGVMVEELCRVGFVDRRAHGSWFEALESEGEAVGQDEREERPTSLVNA